MATVHRLTITLLATAMLCVCPTLVRSQPAAERSAKPKLNAAQRAALAALMERGGILLRLDEQRPGQPLVAVDFASHPEFQDDWLKQLLPFTELTTVGLAGTALTDAGVVQLTKLPKLAQLNLSGTAVTDAGLTKLAGCKQLRRLTVDGAGVTPAGIAALRKALPKLEVAAEPAKPADGSSSAATQSDAAQPADASVARFTARDIRQWREKLVELSALPDDTPNGWSKSPVDPARLLTVFPKLRVRADHVLRAYVFKDDGNSNGFVWALPAQAAFPAADDCPRLESHFLNPPKPFDALDDVMEAIEGDDSLESYLQASILRRELKEFGGGWHGIQWGMNTILDENPWKGKRPTDEAPPHDRPESAADEWKWIAPQPTIWAPEVRRTQDQVVVTFHSYTALAAETGNGEFEKERIIRHTDTYRRGKYRPLVVEKKLAEGPNAVAH